MRSIPAPSPFAALLGEALSEEQINDLLGSTDVHRPERPKATQRAALELLESTDDGGRIPKLDDTPAQPWTEQAIVALHFILLKQIARLEDPATPLEDKLDTLAWVFTEPEKDARPFSFVQCLRVVGLSPLSQTAYFGQLDVEQIRAWIDVNAKRWLRATLARYPHWAQRLIREQPDFVAARLHSDPQWLNEQIKKIDTSSTGDLFGHPGLMLAA